MGLRIDLMDGGVGVGGGGCQVDEDGRAWWECQALIVSGLGVVGMMRFVACLEDGKKTKTCGHGKLGVDQRAGRRALEVFFSVLSNLVLSNSRYLRRPEST
jgi:hypothetical protein